LTVVDLGDASEIDEGKAQYVDCVHTTVASEIVGCEKSRTLVTTSDSSEG
jgi:hypothetical protein